MGFDRPSGDHANAKVIFLISSHLEAGHYFNPHAQRIIEGKMRGAKIICVDPRLSNTASMSDHWLAPWPGTEAAMLLAIARLLLQNDTWDREFVRRWVNWEHDVAGDAVPIWNAPSTTSLRRSSTSTRSSLPSTRRSSAASPRRRSARSPTVVATAVPGKLSSHNWRAAAAGNEGGWQVARCLWLLNVLTGSVGTEGGVSPNGWNKFIPVPPKVVHPQGRWNDLTWPVEYPLAHHEASILLPHFLKEGRGKIDTYFSRVYNPIWTNPDGFSWLEALTDESLVGCHVALTPTWSESAWFADYVLPMGNGAERHDLASYETHSGRWIGFRQPVFRVNAEKEGHTGQPDVGGEPGRGVGGERVLDRSVVEDRPRQRTRNPSALRVDAEPGEPLGIDEYYDLMFRNSIPGLPEAAAGEGLDPLAYMRKYGAFEIPGGQYAVHERVVTDGRHRQDRRGPQRRRCLPSTGYGRTARHARRHRRSHAIHRRWFDRSGDRRQGPVRIPDSVAQTRDVLADAARLGLARARSCPGTSRATCTGKTSTWSMENASCVPTFRLADLDPHALRSGQVAQRDQPFAPDVDPPLRRRTTRHRDERARPHHHPDRLLRDQGLAHRRHPPRRRRCIASHGSVATRRRSGHPALFLGPRRAQRTDAGVRSERPPDGQARTMDA